MPAPEPRVTVVLDRDGTIVIDKHYLCDPDDLEFLPGAVEGLLRMHRAGWRLIVITNQSGVGRGFFSIEDVERVNNRLLQMVREAGADLAGIYFCPHVPSDVCDCRKPRNALLLLAAAQLGFDPASVVVIGDRLSDVELAGSVGARAILIGDTTSAPDGFATPFAQVNDLLAAALLIERERT